MPEALMVSDYIAAAMGRDMQIMMMMMMMMVMVMMMMTMIMMIMIMIIFSNTEILLTTLLRLFQISVSENRIHHRVYFPLQLGFLRISRMTFPMSEMSTKVIMGEKIRGRFANPVEFT